MADYAPNSTARLRLIYSAGRAGTRSFGLRVSRSANAADLVDLAESASAALDAFSLNFRNSMLGVRWEYALADSNTFLPLGTDVPTFPNKSVFDPADRSADAIQATFSGRSTGGARARMVLYGLDINTITGTGQDFKVTVVEKPTIATFVAAINAAVSVGGKTFVGADNQQVQFYEYYNLKHNDYYVRQIRRLG